MINKISEAIYRISMLDTRERLFEGQYPVPEGITYNTHVVIDHQVAILDTVDGFYTKEWLSEINEVLEGRIPDYLIVSHMEPDHSGSIQALIEYYPQIRIIGNAKTFSMIDQFGIVVPNELRMIVKDLDTISLGESSLQFIYTPMIHWPEVMFTLDEASGILFSADAFGSFGADQSVTGSWSTEARRYYANIVGKYGAQVQSAIKKLNGFTFDKICPLHGPMIQKADLHRVLGSYKMWSAWEAESNGVLIVVAGFHGNTLSFARTLQCQLNRIGIENTLIDLSVCDPSYAIGEAFKFKHLVLAATTYDGAYAPKMETFIASMKKKAIQRRSFSLIENGTWAPMSAKLMKNDLEALKSIQIIDEAITIRSAATEANNAQIDSFIDQMMKASI